MYQVSVSQHFDAAHYLRGYQGKCENLHGHRFQVVVSIQAKETDELGLSYDFVQLKRHLGEVLSRFDHTCLNEIAPFDHLNPSSENIARVVYQELKNKLQGEPISIFSIQVWESPQSWITYYPEESSR
jgi:6-pyruvoyltetrahydropterin/6-carboxytetrahydropterin synthase